MSFSYNFVPEANFLWLFSAFSTAGPRAVVHHMVHSVVSVVVVVPGRMMQGTVLPTPPHDSALCAAPEFN